MFPTRIALIAATAAAMALSACSTEKVVDGTVDSTLFLGRTAVKGTVGAGKLVVRGGHRLVTGGEAD